MQSDSRQSISRFHSLAARIGLIFFAAVVALTLLLSTTLYSYFRNDVENSLLSSFSLTVNNNAQVVDDLLTRLDMYMNLIIENKDAFLSTLREYDGNLLNAYHNYIQMLDLLKSNLSVTFGSLISDCSAHFIVDPSMPLSQIMSVYPPRNFRFTPNGTSAHITRSEPYLTEPWFQYALAHPNQDYWFRLNGNTNTLGVIRTLKMGDFYNFRVMHYNLGHIVVTFNASWLDSVINKSHTGSEFELFLLDPDRNILYGTDSSQSGRSMDELIPNLSEAADTVRYDGKDCFIWQNTLKSGLMLVTLLPCSEINMLAMGSVRIVVLVASLLLLVGFVLVFALSRYSTEPIRRLAYHMQNERLSPMPHDRNGFAREVNWLYDAFNGQIEEINRLIEDIRQSEQAQRQTEVQLLQAQINPHFVCNTLDSVCCRALMRGDDDLADILGDLADIMRYNLRNPSEQISLSRELEIVRCYIRIQQTRTKETITLREDINEACLTAVVPKLILQPIVENAVLHSERSEPVDIVIRQKDDHLIIQVRNRFPEITAEQLNAHVAGEITLSSRSTGLGVRNIDKRLQLVYGTGYGLTFSDLPSGVIQAELTLPFVNAPSNPSVKPAMNA